MPKIAYEKKTFKGDKLLMVAQADKIIREYQKQGYRLTVRQLYYRFVAADTFPEDRKWSLVPGTNKWVRDPNGTKNAQPNYDWLGEIISDARMAGYLDWTAIEDRTRELNAVSHWDSPRDILNSCARSFRLDKWDNQPVRLEIWVEKDALEGVVQPAAHELDVAAFSCRGYTSMSSMWEAAQRLKAYACAGQQPVIIHLGDHDPSGIDMTRDIRDRLTNFIEMDWLRDEMFKGVKQGTNVAKVGEIRDSIKARCGGNGIEVRRVALTREQVDEYQPPPNPAKVTDSRYEGYREIHGEESWELDALEPKVLHDLIQATILEYRDEEKWDEKQAAEDTHRGDLKKAARHWDGALAKALKGLGDK